MTQSTYDFAVIVALKEEARYFRALVGCGDLVSISGQTAAPIVDADWADFGRGVLIISGEMGTEPARKSARLAIKDFGVRLIANLGIAGRVADWLRIGDVVVPRVVHDFTSGGKLGEDGGRTTFAHAPTQTAVSSALVGLVEAHLQEDAKLLRGINRRLAARFSTPGLMTDDGVRVVVKPIACVPSVGANDTYRQSLLHSHREIAAMEMESAGIVSEAATAAVEIVILRGLSDGADAHKQALELSFKDENRKFAFEAALYALSAVLRLRAGGETSSTAGPVVEALSADQVLTPDRNRQLDQYETLFAHMVRDGGGDPVPSPVTAICAALRAADDGEPILLLGGKGVGKTTLMQMVQARATQSDATGAGLLAILVRISALEVWVDGVLDAALTQDRVHQAKQQLRLALAASPSPAVVLIDGLNQTGSHRPRLVAELTREAQYRPGTRLLLSAEIERDLHALNGFVRLDIHTSFQITPVEMEGEQAARFVADFAAIRGSSEARAVLDDMQANGIRSADLFILSLFFGPFRGRTYKSAGSLAERYKLYCAGVLTEGQDADHAEPAAQLSVAAKAAFDILISKDLKFGDLDRQATARLVASHASVTSFLVAHHIIEGFQAAKTSNGRPRLPTKELAKRVNFVFPNDVNNFTKQMIVSDRDLERDVIEVMRARYTKVTTLGRSHFAYLAGRVNPDRRAEMLDFLQLLVDWPSKATDQTRERRMLRRSALISRSLLGDQRAPADYADILLSDIDESEFNRGFHLEYYGDAPFDPEGQMASRDDGVSSCDLTFARLMDRIRASPKDPPSLIELLTLLALVQVRHLNGTLKARHRAEILHLLAGPQMANRHLLAPNVRGFIERVGEDLKTDNFELATVLDEWTGLAGVPRTGWLRRRRDAVGEAATFWTDARVESVAEHLVGVMGLAQIFLLESPVGDEVYDKRRIMEMILVHDLAESRLGDLLPKYNNPKAEEAVLWQYGAFATYRGIGDLWRIPELLREFNRGETLEARIAKDLDRLQFILQARAYAAGMSQGEIEGCERASENITTKTVRAIEEIVLTYPTPRRFPHPVSRLD